MGKNLEIVKGQNLKTQWRWLCEVSVVELGKIGENSVHTFVWVLFDVYNAVVYFFGWLSQGGKTARG